MTNEKSEAINQKINELLELAKETDSVMLILFHENNSVKGKHISVYGSGVAVKNLINDAINQNADLKKVFLAARNESFPNC